MHPNKHIREALEYAVAKGFRYNLSKGHAHFVCFVHLPIKTVAASRLLQHRAIPKITHAKFENLLMTAPTNRPKPSRQIAKKAFFNGDVMNHEFTLYINEVISDSMVDRLHGEFSDISCVRQNGVDFIACDIEAETLDAAVRRVIDVVRSGGLTVQRLEVCSGQSGVLG